MSTRPLARTSQTDIARPRHAARRILSVPEFSANTLLLISAGIVLLLVVPPVVFLVGASVTLEQRLQFVGYTLNHYATVFQASNLPIVGNTLIFALCASVIALVLGGIPAWLVARTNAPFRGLAQLAAFVSLSFPALLKVIAWVLLLGPDAGALTTLVTHLFNLSSAPFNLFSFAGMVLLESILWSPIVFLLTVGPFSYMDRALEEAAATSGANWLTTLRHVTLPLSTPALLGVFVLGIIRALESFEVPLLIGQQAGVTVLATQVYRSTKLSLFPSQGEGSAFGVVLIAVVLLMILPYQYATRQASRFTTIAGKSFRSTRLNLGPWRYVAGAYLLVQPILLIVPLGLLVWASFVQYYIPPGPDALGLLTFNNYAQVVQLSNIRFAVTNSVIASVTTATLILALSVVLSWAIARSTTRWRAFVDVLASIPFVFPGIVLGLALLTMFLRIPNPIYGTVWILVLAYVIRFLPYGMRYAHPAVLAMNVELEDAARMAGASTGTMLRKIVAPLMRPSLVALWIYVLLISIRELSMAILLAGPQSQVISVVILDLWKNGQVTVLAALGSLLAVVLTSAALIFQRISLRYGFRG